MANTKRSKIWRDLQHSICTAQTDLAMELLYKIKQEELTEECEKYGYTILYYAVVANDLRVCQFITSMKPETIDHHKLTGVNLNPFIAAISLGRTEICRLFIQCEPLMLLDVNSSYLLVKHASLSLLYWEERSEEKKICKLLVDSITDETLENCISKKDDTGLTLIDILFSFSDPMMYDFFKNLLENEKKIREINKKTREKYYQNKIKERAKLCIKYK
jgi:hypothetical protein